MFTHGAVPHWGKDATLRSKDVLAHELTWAYYRMKQCANKENPIRAGVGESFAQNDVPWAVSKGSEFKFWRDLRPPFHISSIERITDEKGTGSEKDGKMYKINYSCGIDYGSERMWGGTNATFDNKVIGIARVRVPEGFPSARPLQIESWGKPVLNFKNLDEVQGADSPAKKGGAIDPNSWMPIADELKLRADDPRLAACRDSTRRMKTNTTSDVPAMQRLLLGTHATLHDLANVEMKNGQAKGTLVKRKREHRIFTSAAGFVRYSG